MSSPALPSPGELLPYGHPALQVDRIVRADPGRVVAVKAISCHELPATLMIESFLQSCGLLLALPQPRPGHLLILGSVRNLRVTGAARAGDLLVHIVTLLDRYDDMATFTGVSRVGRRTVLTVERAVTLVRAAGTVTNGNRDV